MSNSDSDSDSNSDSNSDSDSDGDSADREASDLDVTASGTIDRSIEAVFSFVADDHVRNHPRWDPDIALEKESDGPVDVGTVVRRRNTRYETPVEETMEVTEFDRPTAMGAVIRGDGYEMRGRTTLRALGPDRTEITLGTTVPEGIDREMVRSKMERSVRNIRELVEAESDAEPAAESDSESETQSESGS